MLIKKYLGRLIGALQIFFEGNLANIFKRNCLSNIDKCVQTDPLLLLGPLDF
jgi:hypothetical protein